MRRCDGASEGARCEGATCVRGARVRECGVSESVFAPATAEISLEPRYRTGGSLREGVEPCELRRVQVVQIDGVLQMILALGQRSSRYVEKAGELCMRSTTESFGDVPWSGARRLANLIAEFDVYPDRWSLDDVGERQFQLVRQLPTDQLSKVLCTSHDVRCCTRPAGLKPQKVESLPARVGRNCH